MNEKSDKNGHQDTQSQRYTRSIYKKNPWSLGALVAKKQEGGQK
jgi:hypothetical protein